MALGSPPSGENTNLWIYPWKEKEISTTAPGAVAVFVFTAKATNTIQPLIGVNTNLEPTRFSVDATNGRYQYYTYDTSAWVLKTGNMIKGDCTIWIRKNGVDYMVDGVTASITSVAAGATYITVTAAQNITAALADAVLLSYAYSATTGPLQSTFCVKDFSVKQNGLDYSVINCMGGIVNKRKGPQELTEVSLTTLKDSSALASMMIGAKQTVTMNSISTAVTTGANYVGNWAVVLRVTDPDNGKNRIGWFITNAGAQGIENKGGASADFEETVSFKCDPECYAEFEYVAP